MLSAKDLPRCDLSDHLEARLERALAVRSAGGLWPARGAAWGGSCGLHGGALAMQL